MTPLIRLCRRFRCRFLVQECLQQEEHADHRGSTDDGEDPCCTGDESREDVEHE